MVNSNDLSKTILIRDARSADVAAISQIYNYYVSNSTATFAEENETIAERQVWFDNHVSESLPVLVAEKDGLVVGWASLSYYHQRSAYRQSVEISFYIADRVVGCGIGKLLTEKLLEIARQRKYHCVLSLVCSENAASLALLSKFDFATAGVLKEVGKKFDRWLDVTIMQKMLSC